MMRGFGAVGLGLILIGGCSPADDAAPDEESALETTAATDAAPSAMSSPAATGVAVVCSPQGMPLEGRVSPYDSTTFTLGGQEAKVCYGRPSANDREIFGDLVPYDTLWRTGANEPTTIHLPFPAEIAGMAVEPGSYSIYTVPGREQWTAIVNRSTSQWGIETQYTDAIRAQEVGRAPIPIEPLEAPVETFVITAEQTGPNSADLVLDWEQTRARIPIERL